MNNIESLLKEHGYEDFRWIKPEDIAVSQWVRMKCMYGCNEYGVSAVCPPNVPSVAECERFFSEYSEIVIFHFATTVKDPEARFVWTKKINLKLLKLEREVFLLGYPKTFLLFMDTCNICPNCTGLRIQCQHRKQARPSAEALAVDVFSTVKKVGFPINVLSNYDQEMNRYAFLLIR